jgi:hypothetical protein
MAHGQLQPREREQLRRHTSAVGIPEQKPSRADADERRCYGR